MAAGPVLNSDAQTLSPRRRMYLWVRDHRHLDMLSLRVQAVQAFADDAEMVEFALGQVAVWEAANLGHASRQQTARSLLQQDNPESESAVAKFLAAFPQSSAGLYIEIATMTRPLLAASIADSEVEIAGRMRHLDLQRAIYDLLPNDRVTVAGFFAANRERRSILIEIVRTYEGGV